MAQQLKYMLQTVEWPDGDAEVVFGSRGVTIFAGRPTLEQIPPGFPFAMVSIGTGLIDQDHPDLLQQNFEILYAVNVGGDPLGEFAMIGSSTANIGHSAGRGLLEIQERVRSAIENLVDASGVKIVVQQTSIEAPTQMAPGQHIAIGADTVSAICTRAPYYAAPQNLQVSSDTWTWDGDHCSSRFDFIQYRLAYASGATPPTLTPATPAPEEATVAYTGTTATTTQTAGTGRAWVIVADYGSRSSGTVEGTSSTIVGSWVQV